jgi:hypothetical protein
MVTRWALNIRAHLHSKKPFITLTGLAEEMPKMEKPENDGK